MLPLFLSPLLVPTRVGMILVLAHMMYYLPTCPHTRGDDPLTTKVAGVTVNLSPHAWG